jgi:hypothetical protein
MGECEKVLDVFEKVLSNLTAGGRLMVGGLGHEHRFISKEQLEQAVQHTRADAWKDFPDTPDAAEGDAVGRDALECLFVAIDDYRTGRTGMPWRIFHELASARAQRAKEGEKSPVDRLREFVDDNEELEEELRKSREVVASLDRQVDMLHRQYGQCQSDLLQTLERLQKLQNDKQEREGERVVRFIKTSSDWLVEYGDLGEQSGLPEGRYAIRPLPEKVVRPWRLRYGAILCPKCHQVWKRGEGDDPDILPPCLECGVKFGEPTDLPDASDE